jgi:hypothetical protein
MNETILFWVVFFAFLIADNVVAIPQGKDFLTINRLGQPHYKSRQRNQFAAKELILLNPFNLFDRGVMAEKLTAQEYRASYKNELRSISLTAKKLNVLIYLGYAYLSYLFLNCYLSLVYGFEAVVAHLVVGHLSVWVIASLLIWRYSKLQFMPNVNTLPTLIECLFVPAYLVNLNKNLLRLKHTPLCSLRLYARQLSRSPENEKELIQYQLDQQIQIALETETHPSRQAALKEFLKCLKN